MGIPGLIGTVGNDLIMGLEGDDHIISGQQQNTLDTFSDVIYGGDGNDNIQASNGDDFLYGGNGDDSILGYGGNDHIYGGDGIDDLHGWSGNDILYGGTGNDLLGGGLGDDIIYAGSGDDLISGDEGSDTLISDYGINTLHGQVYNNVGVPPVSDDDADTFILHYNHDWPNSGEYTYTNISGFWEGNGDILDISNILTVDFDPLQHSLSDFIYFYEKSWSDSRAEQIRVDADGLGTEHSFQTVAEFVSAHSYLGYGNPLEAGDESRLYTNGQLIL